MTTPCPCEGCETVYDCDACLDSHLRHAHGASYSQAFGSVPQAWIGLCTRHTGVPMNRLGAVREATPDGLTV